MSQNVSNNSLTVYVALLFTSSTYSQGILDTLELIQKEYPNSKLVFEKYVVNQTQINTNKALTNFIKKYPSGNRVTVSEKSSILDEIILFFQENKIEDIFSLSVSATALKFKKQKNIFTYGYYLDKSVMTSFLIIKDYAIENIGILIDNKSANFTFFNSYSETIQKQNSLLDNLNIFICDLSKSNQKIFIPENSFVYLLAETHVINKNIHKIKNAFLGNKSSCLFLTNSNYDIKDIFGDIPAFVSLNCPANYTITSNKVYLNLKNKLIYSYDIYPFYDILYSLQFMSDNKIIVNNKNYIDVASFQTIPEAFSNSLQYDGSINGFQYGMYNIMFTKNSLLNTPQLLSTYNKYNYNNGNIPKLPNSQSIFKTTGIIPFFESSLYYVNQDLIKIYDKKNELKYLKFDANNTKNDTDNFIAVSEIQPPKFIINYDSESNLFSYLEKIYTDKARTNPKVNSRMSKIDQIYYL